jgi:hypothetical protein
MALIGGRRRRLPQPIEADGPPAWAVRWFLFEEKPERGTPEWTAFVRARWFPDHYRVPSLGEIFHKHRAAIEAAWKEQGRRGQRPYYRGIYDGQPRGPAA